MPNFLSLRARLEDLYLQNSYKKIAVSCFEKKRPVFCLFFYFEVICDIVVEV